MSLLPLNLSGEGDSEHSENVAVVGFDIANCLYHGSPFLDREAKLVSGGVETIERCPCIFSSNLINNKLNFPPKVVGVLLGEIGLEISDYSPFNSIFNFLETSCFVGAGVAEGLRLEGDWSPELEPLLPGEGVNGSLLSSLPGSSFLFSWGHDNQTISETTKIINKNTQYSVSV